MNLLLLSTLLQIKMPTVPTYDLPQSPILIIGFFGMAATEIEDQEEDF